MNTNNSTSSNHPLRIVIIGGVAGGASSAARARRLNEFAHITVIERGPDVSFANCGLPYFIGEEITDRSKLALQTPESLRSLLKLDVRANTEAISIDRKNKTVRIRNLTTNAEEHVSYDKLILSPGASPLRPPLPGIDLPNIYTLRNLQDMDKIKAAVHHSQSVLVIGAGFIGLEMAEQIVHLKKHITLVELSDQVLPQMDKEMVQTIQQELVDAGVSLVLGDGIKSFEANGNAITAQLNSGTKLTTDTVILSIGVRPENGLAKDAELNIGKRGHIITNPFMQTSDPDIYAVGDVCETTDPIFGGMTAIPLGSPANRQGRTAADHIMLGNSAKPYPGSIGTAVVRVFDICAGVTGYTEKRLQQLGIAYEKTIVTDYHHASYYPGATFLTLKLIWEPTTGRILGGQVFGANGVDKRLDILATAIKGRLTVDDLEHIEFAYAPPYGSAKDVIHIAGFSANNIRSGRLRPMYSLPDANTTQLVDVRPPENAQLAPIPGAINIPYGQLRNNLNKLDKNKPVTTVCAMGKMSYFASRILIQNGFNASGFIGGIKIANTFKNTPSAKTTSSSSTQNATTLTPMKTLEPLKLDATGIACPGPILRVKEFAAKLAVGQTLEVSASDAGFKNDLPAFCKANGYTFLGVEKKGGILTGRLCRDTASATSPATCSTNAPKNGSTIVVFSGELDKVMAAYVIANGALAMGGKATLFFTFWGLNAIRKDPAPIVYGKTFMDKMFGWMLPRGANRLPLSNMHMLGAGTLMMKDRMKNKGLPNLPGLMESARKGGVRLVACTMSMEAMGIREEELIEGVELGGVAEYLGAASETSANLFI